MEKSDKPVDVSPILEETNRFDSRNYAPIEHFLIGSTVKMGDDLLDVRSLIQKARAGSKDAYRKLLTPVRLQEKAPFVETLKHTAETAIERQKEKRNRTQKGGVFIDRDQTIELSIKDRLEIFIEPSQFNYLRKMVAPSWRIRLVSLDGNVSSDRTKLDQLRLEESCSADFKLQNPSPQDPDQSYQLLSLNMSQAS